jgi:hypothetical protein
VNNELPLLKFRVKSISLRKLEVESAFLSVSTVEKLVAILGKLNVIKTKFLLLFRFWCSNSCRAEPTKNRSVDYLRIIDSARRCPEVQFQFTICYHYTGVEPHSKNSV